MAWTHDSLLSDLAAYLRGPDRMVWCDMQLGPSGSPRPDVFTLQKSYSAPRPAAFEIKVSRSDFRSDTTSGKWQSYLRFAGSVTFAVPDGLVTIPDVPAGCGLIVRKEQVWRYVRRPTIQHMEMPFSACMKLLIDGVSRVSTAPEPRSRTIATWAEHEGVRRKFGSAVALAARDIAAAESRLASTKLSADYEYDRMRKEVAAQREILVAEAKRAASEYEGAKRAICSWLGLPEDSSVHAVRRSIDVAKLTCDSDARVRAAEDRLQRARYALESASRALAPEPSVAAA